MSERVMEIVAYIVNAMQSSLDEAIIGGIENLSQLLIEEGYTENEINSAFSWLIEKIPSNVDCDYPVEQSFPDQQDRTWYSFDKSAFTPAGFNFLIQLRELDIIGDEEIEQILDQSLRNGKHGISISEIKALVSNLIFNTDPIMDGSFFVFNKNYQVH
ncbi:MAG: DUF494 family protein [bacterium]|nr:MAG: DUF494 family protein [bacterium]